MLRNEEVKPEAIREGGFAATVRQAQGHALLLAVEDTTSVSYEHAVAAQLGTTSNSPHAKRRGYQVHSVLLLDAARQQTVGLIEQTHWCREASGYGKKRQRKKRAYADKESYKWEQASVQVQARLGGVMARTISVCDREADLYEYLRYKLQHGQRFVVRAKADRRVLDSEAGLFETLEKQGVEWCCYTVQVPQRGGRPARTAKLSLRGATLAVMPPASGLAKGELLWINAVLAEEIDASLGVEPLRWVLLTTERCSPPPSPPSAHWAYLALAKLGGFADTKRTGRPGWDTLWHGWFRLQERVKGHQLSQLTRAKL